jgi:hypothetical protein
LFVAKRQDKTPTFYLPSWGWAPNKVKCVLTASGDDLAETSDDMKNTRTFADLEKRRLVTKLRVGREAKKAATGKCGGRMNYQERSPEVVALAKELAKPPAGSAPNRGLSLRQISAELAKRGHFSATGTPFTAAAISRMLGDAHQPHGG